MSNSAAAAEKENSKGAATAAAVTETNWKVVLAIRHALKNDSAEMQRTASVTDSSRTHIELIIRYKCSGGVAKCRWCKGGAKATKGRHSVIYTVRNTATAKGVLRLTQVTTLNAKGGWTLYAVKLDENQLNALIQFCEHYIGSPYLPLASFMCIKSCCPCCGRPWYEEAARGELTEPYAMTCSMFVATALIHCGVLERGDDDSEILDPFRMTPDDVVNALHARKCLVPLSEIATELAPASV